MRAARQDKRDDRLDPALWALLLLAVALTVLRHLSRSGTDSAPRSTSGALTSADAPSPVPAHTAGRADEWSMT
ncbi:hypothetical protein, partial [Arthrobacter sp.]|uniref:hypothetical protein n=1 Tax=Arthrobacter sp. TaxID=1667 RepID=UPI00281185A0